MSPMGSGGRGTYSSQATNLAKGSPSLAKRGTLGLRQQDPVAACHKNIWPNPMQALPGGCLSTWELPKIYYSLSTGQDLSYLQSLQAQSFPHIPKTQLAQLSEPPKMDKMDIYENPSEHYASINNYGIAGTVDCSSHLEDGNSESLLVQF